LGWKLDRTPWWSGGQATPLTAKLVTVRTGQSTVENERLVPGATVAGRVVDKAGQPASGILTAVNAITGDPVSNLAFPEGNGAYRITGLFGPQLVKVQFVPDDQTKPSVSYPRPVFVSPSGSVTGIDIVTP
jgi:hypothetical protein